MISTRRKPPFRAEIVGSLLRPPEVLRAREDLRQGRISSAQLRAIEDAAIREIVRRQEDIGLEVVTDGEFRRDSWQWDFLRQIGGVTTTAEQATTPFRNEQGPVPRTYAALKVTGPLTLDKVVFGDDFAFLKSVTRVTPKLTIPSPSLLHRRGGSSVVDAHVYPDLEAFWDALAAVYGDEIEALGRLGCTYLQLDDTSFAALCDGDYRESLARSGTPGDRLHLTYIRLINAALKKKPAGMTVCVHTCRGNYRSSWITSGGYDFIADALFNTLEVDGFLLEYDDSRSGGFEPLRFVPKGKMIVLGLVTTKRGALERKDDLKRRVAEAAQYVPLEQLCLSPQCGFASVIDGNALTVDEQFAKLRLVVETAREVWGDASTARQPAAQA